MFRASDGAREKTCRCVALHLVRWATILSLLPPCRAGAAHRGDSAVSPPELRADPCRGEIHDIALLKQSKANMSTSRCGRMVDVVTDLSVDGEQIHSDLTATSKEEPLWDVEPILETLTIFGLQTLEAVRHRDVFARVLAASLPKVTPEDVRILRVSDGHHYASSHNGRRDAKDRRALRAAGRRGQRLSGVQIDFEVAPSRNSTSDAMESVEAWLLLLREAGQASHRFDASLEAALIKDGVTLALLDGESLHAEFGTPRRLLPEVENDGSDHATPRSLRSSPQKGDSSDIVAVVFLGFIVLVIGSVLVASMIARVTDY